MNQAIGNSGPQFADNIADTLRVELHHYLSPDVVAYSFGSANLYRDGTIIIPNIPCGVTGYYYLVIKHRSSIETWSYPININGVGPFDYDFTTEAGKAYASNMKLMPDNIYTIYGGDANQDGLVDGSDMAMIDNANILILVGYNPEDVNGDGLVDGSDMAIIDNNSRNVAYVKRP